MDTLKSAATASLYILFQYIIHPDIADLPIDATDSVNMQVTKAVLNSPTNETSKRELNGHAVHRLLCSVIGPVTCDWALIILASQPTYKITPSSQP
jgi:hypothetical protein